MARTYAQVKVSMWTTDDDWRRLGVGAQHLYLVLLTNPGLNLAGVVDWRPRRIATLAAGWSEEQLELAAAELEAGGYLVIDRDTEEALIRSFVRNDGVLKNPKVAVGMASAWAEVYSPRVRGCISEEVRRLLPTIESQGVQDAIAQVAEYVHEEPSDQAPDGAADQAPDQVADRVSNRVSDGASEGVSDTPSDRVADQVALPPASFILHPASGIQHPLGAASSDADTPPDTASSKRRGTRLPADFVPSEDSRRAIITEWPDLDVASEHRKFADYWPSMPGQRGVRTDWDAVWRNWMRRAGQDQARQASRGMSRHERETAEMVAFSRRAMGLSVDDGMAL